MMQVDSSQGGDPEDDPLNPGYPTSAGGLRRISSGVKLMMRLRHYIMVWKLDMFFQKHSTFGLGR